MDTPTDRTPDHVADAGIRLAASLASFDRAEALYVLDFARIIVERFFEEQALPPNWRTPRLRVIRGTLHPIQPSKVG
jgi:hypothetical protein